MSYATLRSKIEQLIEKAKNGGGNVFIRYSNDKGLTFFVPDQPSMVPTGYTEVEYLESSGTQYIDTGYVFKTKPLVRTNVFIMTTSDLDIMGTASAVAGCFIVDYANESIYYRYGSSSSVKATSLVGAGEWIEAEYGPQLIENGDIRMTVSTWDFSGNSQPFMLFRGRNYAQVRIKETEMYDDDVLVRHFVPCIRDADGVPGMFDTVENQFYVNQGTGAFETGEHRLTVGRYVGIYVGSEEEAPNDTSLYKWSLISNNGELLLQNKTVTASSEQQIISADDGFDGLGEVTVVGNNIAVENLANPDGIIPNKYLSGDGREIGYNGWSISDYIPVDSSKVYSVVPISIDHQYSEFYDENKQFLSGVSSSNFSYAETGIFYFRAFSVPDGAKFVRFSQTTANIQALGVYEVQGEL